MQDLVFADLAASRWVSAMGLGSPRTMRAAPRRILRMGQVPSSLAKKISPMAAFRDGSTRGEAGRDRRSDEWDLTNVQGGVDSISVASGSQPAETEGGQSKGE